MDKNLKNERLKYDLIQRIGPWAFCSYPKESWLNLRDEEIISGALLRAKPDDKLMLLNVYSLKEIKAVWEKHVVMQDKWFHDVNLWIAQNIFKFDDPEKFVRNKYKKYCQANSDRIEFN